VARTYACRIYFDPGAGRAAVEADGARLEVSFDIEQVPHVAISIDKPGWSPFGKRRSARTVALAPSIGSPDSLSEALGAWRDAAWLEPGETREWQLTWRASSAEPAAALAEEEADER
jgi:hypothetical protein